jgi:hypothetical protein
LNYISAEYFKNPWNIGITSSGVYSRIAASILDRTIIFVIEKSNKSTVQLESKEYFGHFSLQMLK